MQVTSKRRFGAILFRFIYSLIIVMGVVAYFSLQGQSTALDEKNAALAKAPTIAGTVNLDGTEVVVPNTGLFAPGEMWSLASRKHPLPEGFSVYDLVDSPVETGGGEKLQVAKRIVNPLKALVDAADTEGHYLMISSAYRSVADQQDTYDSYILRYGEQMAKDYVSPPGSSEHHTGLAIDFSDYSDACEQDSEKCSLGMETAGWLEENAPTYGFVLRYPEGKKDITGVGYEWWHFRYVGVPLAKAVAASDLTLDEAIEQMETISARE